MTSTGSITGWPGRAPQVRRDESGPVGGGAVAAVLGLVVVASGLFAGTPAHAGAARTGPDAASHVSAAVATFAPSALLRRLQHGPSGGRAEGGQPAARVNRARTQARTCGAVAYRAAPPLHRDGPLGRVARRHARDMARHSYVDHTGRSGSTPSSRAAAAGYRGRVGENIAAGQSRPAQVIRAWLASPAHCANVMSRQYRDLGVGYAYAAGSRYGSYWVLDLGRR